MSLISNLQNDNFVWDALYDALPPSRRRGYGKFDININCPVCVQRGHPRPDQFYRCGLKRAPNGLGINCFNCGFKVRWQVGKDLNDSLAMFLRALGIGDTDVKRLALRAYQIARTFQSAEVEILSDEGFEPKFMTNSLPTNARPLSEWQSEDCQDPNFLQTVAYVNSRGRDIASNYTYYWSPETKHDMNQRVIIPMTFQGRIVGYTARSTGSGKHERKYHADTPEDFLFNNEALTMPHRKFVTINEGPFDAIGVLGVGTLGAKLSENQARWINGSGKIPILVFDRDRAGVRNIENALRHKWYVAFPRLHSAGWWDADTTDVGKAVELYGSLYVIQSILDTMTNDARQIEVLSSLTL